MCRRYFRPDVSGRGGIRRHRGCKRESGLRQRVQLGPLLLRAPLGRGVYVPHVSTSTETVSSV